MATSRAKAEKAEKVTLEGRHEIQTDDGGNNPRRVFVAPHASELCPECGVHTLPVGATQYSCEHGTWDLTIQVPNDEVPQPEQVKEGGK